MATAVSVTDMITIVTKVDAYDLCSRCSCMIRSEERRCSGTNALTDSCAVIAWSIFKSLERRHRYIRHVEDTLDCKTNQSIIPMGVRDFLTLFPAHPWRSDPNQPCMALNGYYALCQNTCKIVLLIIYFHFHIQSALVDN